MSEICTNQSTNQNGYSKNYDDYVLVEEFENTCFGHEINKLVTQICGQPQLHRLVYEFYDDDKKLIENADHHFVAQINGYEIFHVPSICFYEPTQQKYYVDDLMVPLGIYATNKIILNHFVNVSDEEVEKMKKYDETTNHSFTMTFRKMNKNVKYIKYSIYCHKSLESLYTYSKFHLETWSI
jgi:hypothetical protein